MATSWITTGEETTIHDGREVKTTYDGGMVQVSIDGFRIMHGKHFAILKEQTLRDDGWEPHSYNLPESIGLWTRPAPLSRDDGKRKLNMIRGKMQLSCSVHTAFDAIFKHVQQSAETVIPLSPTNEIQKVLFPIFDRELLVQTAWGEIPEGYAMLCHSVTHNKFPASKSKTAPQRATSYGTGCLITGNESSCCVWIKVHLDMKVQSSTIGEDIVQFVTTGLQKIKLIVNSHPDISPIEVKKRFPNTLNIHVESIIAEECGGREQLIEEAVATYPRLHSAMRQCDVVQSCSSSLQASSIGDTMLGSSLGVTDEFSLASTPHGGILSSGTPRAVAPSNVVSDTQQCRSCASQFSQTRRRYCCLTCGDAFCASCTVNRCVVLPEGQRKVARCCNNCQKQQNGTELAAARDRIRQLEKELDIQLDSQRHVAQTALQQEHDRTEHRRALFMAGKHHSKTCGICSLSFRFFRREHHCRFCFRSVCDPCSQSKLQALRMCDWCSMSPPPSMPVCAKGHTAAIRAAEYQNAANKLWVLSQEESPPTPLSSSLASYDFQSESVLHSEVL
eukprot:TRINITY_DN10262_c1_g1_i1.p1 TRINITY_DN10262_c1_g1~~TRINITY_DN10262_c1_g1_i1.p1  ORF type:complete len:560 (+),score=104.04 TRINITY_DN10262_c1_g1_i1:58-1737(+)